MEILRRLRDEGRAYDMQALADAIPYARSMGLRVEHRGNELTTIMPFQESLIGNVRLPAIHGGALGALLEFRILFQLVFDDAGERLPKTIDISIDYLRSGKPIDSYARAEVVRRGRRVANVRAQVWQDDRERPIAAAHGNFLLQSLV